jgi:ribosomal protein L14E/L6E/L27E
MVITRGQVVYSKGGHDKGLPFIVFLVDKGYLYLVDGKLRTLNKPKKKKIIHVQPTKDIIYPIQEKLDKNLYLLDADIRKALLPYVNVLQKVIL